MAQAFTSMRRDRCVICVLYECRYSLVWEDRETAERSWKCREDPRGVGDKPEPVVYYTLDMSLARGHPENVRLPTATAVRKWHYVHTWGILFGGWLYSL